MKKATRFLGVSLIMAGFAIVSCSKESEGESEVVAISGTDEMANIQSHNGKAPSVSDEVVIGGNALLIDDFETGPMTQQSTGTIGKETFDQNGDGIIGKKRTVVTRIKENPDEQTLNTKITNGKLLTSLGYGITGVVELQYGWGIPHKLNLNLSGYQHMHIEYEGKSNFGRVYVDLFSNGPNRAFWRGAGDPVAVYQGSISDNGSSGPFELKIPLNQFTSAQDNAAVENLFTLTDVDNIKVYFISQSQPGLNFAVKKIWFE